MDNILEIIGPVIIGVIYLLGSLFSKKSEADETTPEPLPDHDFEAEEQEYQRHVQSLNAKQHQQAASEGSRNSSWDQPADSHDQKIKVQLKKIEATKREASRLKSQQSESAQKRTQAKGEYNNPQTTRVKSSFGSVRSSLKDPKAARSAFIYGEVLGPPVSLRKDKGVPGLTS